MQQRYFVEILIFVALAVTFQVYIDKFNTDKQTLVKALRQYYIDQKDPLVDSVKLKAEIDKLDK